jgi:hypothetical protein
MTKLYNKMNKNNITLNEMKRILFSIAVMLAVVNIQAQTDDYFTPYKATSLRLPAVPLIVNDPYLSIWSSYNKLTDGPTNYWYSSDVQKPIDGLLRVDGKVYRFMGAQNQYILGNAVVPMADEEAWTAQVTHTTQSSIAWTRLGFDDSSWDTQTGAFGSAKEYPNVNTSWTDTNSDIYIRRTVDLTAEDLTKDLYLDYSHDDVFELYINGRKIVGTGNTWGQGFKYHLTDADKAALIDGTNVIAAHCHNTIGGAYVDFGIYENVLSDIPAEEVATQNSVHVLATNTYYNFTCGSVNLDLVFTAPMLIDNPDLISTPINYVSYKVTSNDGNAHNVQIYFAVSPQLSVSSDNQTTLSTKLSRNNVTYIRSGNATQSLHSTGDHDAIDWGYVYLPSINGNVSIAMPNGLESTFVNTGALPSTKLSVKGTKLSEYPMLAFTNDLGDVATTASNFMMIGYDEGYSMQFLGTKYKGYWARDGKTIYTAFEEMRDNYDDIMTRCRALDKRIYDDALASGNVKYAELLSGSYRHVMAAHGMFQDNDGDLMFFSRENNSGGFVNTVDLTYPEAPLFLMYNDELQKGMMTSIFKYCESDRWGFGFAAHDLGSYPVADNQLYGQRFPSSDGSFGSNMPLEESGNLVTLAATISMLDGNTDYANRFWTTIKTWADYLVQYGQDPEDQLCTDDFAGRSTHNTNLSMKAIMGIAGYALMAKMKGDTDTYNTYMDKAKTMATKWEADARTADGTHYKRTFDLDNTWSQKYNMVWDKLWQINIVPNDAMSKEITYYLTLQNKYGLPLDNRAIYSKNDWIMWTASMAPNTNTFTQFADLVYKYVNETTSRVPIGDWYYTDSGSIVGFRARSVIGGFWMKVLMDHFDPNIPHSTGISNISDDTPAGKTVVSRYNLSGQQIAAPVKGINIVKYSDGSTKKVIVK